MSFIELDFASCLLIYTNYLRKIKDLNTRRKELCVFYKYSHGEMRRTAKSMVIQSFVFPSIDDKIFFLKFALDEQMMEMISDIEAGDFNVHDVIFNDGKSALHYIAGVYESTDFINVKDESRFIIEHFLRNPEKNYCDDHGYTYFHGACMVGELRTVEKFILEGVDVNIKTYTRSPIHIAAQNRHEDVVEILLKHGANSNEQDHEQWTALHALARPCLCNCVCAYAYCDFRRPVGKIVKMLVENGANIEARNLDGDTPLQLAVSRFDVDLTRALLKHGADLNNLNKDRIFNMNFSSLELRCYALTLNIIEVVKLLESLGYTMDLHTRIRMVKCWIKAQGNDYGLMLVEDTGNDELDLRLFQEIVKKMIIYKTYNFHIQKEASDYLHLRYENLKEDMLEHDYEPDAEYIDMWTEGVDIMKTIKITEDVSLYQLCQISCSEGYSVIRNIKNWDIPSMDLLSCDSNYLIAIAKRHIANILVRPWLNLELIATDLLMTDYFGLNLPYTFCREMVKKMNDKDLFNLFLQINENNLDQFTTELTPAE